MARQRVESAATYAEPLGTTLRISMTQRAEQLWRRCPVSALLRHAADPYMVGVSWWSVFVGVFDPGKITDLAHIASRLRVATPRYSAIALCAAATPPRFIGAYSGTLSRNPARLERA